MKPPEDLAKTFYVHLASQTVDDCLSLTKVWFASYIGRRSRVYRLELAPNHVRPCITRYRAWCLKYTYGRDVVSYCQLRLTSRCRHPAPGQDLIPLQRLHVFAHSRGPHPAIKLWCQVPFTKSKTIFQIETYCMQCFLKSNILIAELSTIKIGELLRKWWSLRSCFLILPQGALTPRGIEGATKRDVSKHLCAIQWCASRGWFIAHDNWTSCGLPHVSTEWYNNMVASWNFIEQSKVIIKYSKIKNLGDHY